MQKILEIWLLLRENARPTMCHVKKKIRDSLSGLLAVELQNFRMISSHFLYCVRTPVDVKKSSPARRPHCDDCDKRRANQTKDIPTTTHN